jgi:hypothetical protein
LINVVCCSFIFFVEIGGDLKKIRMTTAIADYTSETTVEMTPEALYNHMISVQASGCNANYSKRVSTLGDDDLARPLVGRGVTMQMAADMFHANDQAHSVGNLKDRRNYMIPAAACIPGMGKTRMLNMLEAILDLAGVKIVHMALIVQYCHGQSLQWVDSHLSVECAFCWRILHVVFMRDNGWNFQEFCCSQFLPRNCDSLTLSATLKTLRFALENDLNLGFSPDDIMVVTLGIDEFQKISANEEDQKAKLTQLCTSLYENSYSNKVHVYPMFAGTDWTLIQESGRSSGLPVKRLPMPLLDAKQVDKMVQSLLLDLPFTASLAVRAGLPAARGPDVQQKCRQAFE